MKAPGDILGTESYFFLVTLSFIWQQCLPGVREQNGNQRRFSNGERRINHKGDPLYCDALAEIMGINVVPQALWKGF